MHPSLDGESGKEATRMKLARMLNQTAAYFGTEETDPDVLMFDPYVDLKFSEFRPARNEAMVLRPMLPIGAAVPTAASVAEIESGDKADCIEVPDSTNESDDEVERNELGDVVAPKAKPVEQIFDQNLYWCSSPKVAGEVHFSAVND